MAEWKMVEKMRMKKEKTICRKAFRKACCKDGQRVGLRLAAVLIALTACVLSGGIPANQAVAAAAQTAVTLTAEENQAEVALELPAGEQAGQQGYGAVKSLQLGFQVNILHGEGEKYQVSFLFDEGITCSVKQFSYQEETGLLQIYLSGAQNLYEGSSITLGKIVVESESASSSGVTASIRVAENSLKIVNDAFALKEQPFSASEMVQVTAGGKQTEEDRGTDGEADGSSSSAGQSGSKEKPAGETEQAGGETPEQEPLLRLVRTEERGRFSLNNFLFQGLLANKKACIVLVVVAVAVVALVSGTITRIVHNRKKKKKKWW